MNVLVSQLTLMSASSALIGLIPTSACAEEHEPHLCNFARVQTHGSPLEVWTKPGGLGDPVERLANGAVVYVCDESGNWYRIAFGRDGEPCSVVRNQGWPTDDTQTCRSGWVSREWIEVISG